MDNGENNGENIENNIPGTSDRRTAFELKYDAVKRRFRYDDDDSDKDKDFYPEPLFEHMGNESEPSLPTIPLTCQRQLRCEEARDVRYQNVISHPITDTDEETPSSTTEERDDVYTQLCSQN